MSMPSPLSTLNRNAIITLAREGYTTRAIGRAFGVTCSTVSNTLIRRGMSLAHERGRKDKKRSVSLLRKTLAHVRALRTTWSHA